VKSVKKRIREKLEMSKEDFAKCKLAIISYNKSTYLKDGKQRLSSTNQFDCFIVIGENLQAGMFQENDYLGLEHPAGSVANHSASNPALAALHASTRRAEKAITIKAQ
jgi:hypothetical protein